MNREIKFRGKRSKDDEWVYGGLVYRLPKHPEIIINEYITHQNGECEDNFVFYQDIYEDTVGQFTGLQDKNGKEIYEGDILMCIGERNDNKGRKYYRKVLFDNGAFGMTVPEYKFISALCNHVVNGKLNWEVIGNIYDNPELLEEKL